MSCRPLTRDDLGQITNYSCRVSAKTVEFHLGHIFGKPGIRSRKDLITRTGAPPPRPARNLGSYLGADPGALVIEHGPEWV